MIELPGWKSDPKNSTHREEMRNAMYLLDKALIELGGSLFVPKHREESKDITQITCTETEGGFILKRVVKFEANDKKVEG